MMDNARRFFVVARGGLFAAVEITAFVVIARRFLPNLRPIGFVSALTISTVGRGKCAAANGESEDSGENQFLECLVHFRPSLSDLVCYALDHLALTLS